jgi:hypothetical protein
LLGDAAAFRQSTDIRSFVADVEARYTAGDVPVSHEELDAWRSWALNQAERIDPVRSGHFLGTMKDEEPPAADGE